MNAAEKAQYARLDRQWLAAHGIGAGRNLREIGCERFRNNVNCRNRYVSV